MKNVITGYEAIDAKKENPEIELNKYNDPIEDERFDISIDEAREIAGEDSSLIYAEIEENEEEKEFSKKVNEALYLYTDTRLYNPENEGIRFAVAVASKTTSKPSEIYPIALEVIRLFDK